MKPTRGGLVPSVNHTRLALWLALCGILGLSATVYTLRTENARLRLENDFLAMQRDDWRQRLTGAGHELVTLVGKG